jgi:hypothetical protein
VRIRTRTVLVAFTLAILTTVLVPGPAHADEVKQQTHLVAQFNSGDTGWVKIALERDYLGRARAHVGVWCQDSTGFKVACGAIEFKDFSGLLTVDYWYEVPGGTDRWQPIIYKPIDYLDDWPPHTLNECTDWLCAQGTDQYRAVIRDVRIQDIFGQWSGWKTRTHPTWLGWYCDF